MTCSDSGKFDFMMNASSPESILHQTIDIISFLKLSHTLKLSQPISESSWNESLCQQFFPQLLCGSDKASETLHIELNLNLRAPKTEGLEIRFLILDLFESFG